MRFTITGRNMNVSERLQDRVTSKLSKLERYFREDQQILVTLSTEKDQKKIEVTIPIKGTTIRAEESSEDMFTSIDMVEETIVRQVDRHKSRLIDRYQSGFNPQYIEEEPVDETPEDDLEIVRTKHFALKPMDPEEACLQMDMLGHSFYVFRDGDSGQVCVVYRRKDGRYGLIEPE